jgi:hypothetical protein
LTVQQQSLEARRESLEARVGRLEGDAPLALDHVDLAVRDPVRLRLTFGEIFGYIATVEGAVPQNVAEITTLLPDLGELDRRFLEVWSGHEQAHAAIFEALRAELGLVSGGFDRAPESAVPPRPPAPPPRTSFRLFGLAARSSWLQGVFTLVYLARGAMHEHLTYDCYRHLGAQLEGLGEHALATTVCDPIRRQEAGHLGYYRLAAATQRNRLSPAQVALARTISIRTYAPVGATPCGRETAGRVCAGLAGEHLDDVLDAVQALAQQLLGDAAHPLPPFVHDVMRR